MIYACAVRCMRYIAEREARRTPPKPCSDRIKEDIRRSLAFLTDGERSLFGSEMLRAMREAHRAAGGTARIGGDMSVRAGAVLDRAEPMMRRACRAIAERADARMRREAVRDMLGAAGTVLYYVPRHPRCAEDHADYEGRYYVDADWRDKVADPRDRRELARFVEKNRIGTVQDISGRAPWLTTRPNCRHRFVAVPMWAALIGKAPPESGRDMNERVGAASDYDKRRAYVGWRFAEAVASGMPCAGSRARASGRRRIYMKRKGRGI